MSRRNCILPRSKKLLCEGQHTTRVIVDVLVPLIMENNVDFAVSPICRLTQAQNGAATGTKASTAQKEEVAFREWYSEGCNLLIGGHP